MKKLWLIVGMLCLLSWPLKAQEAPKVEVFGGYSYLRADTDPRSNANGWSASLAANVNRYFGLAADFSGHYGSQTLNLSGTQAKVDGSAHTFLFGPRFSYRKHERVTPFAHVLLGGVRDKIAGRIGSISISETDTAFGLALGGGLDVQLHRHVALRLIQADYLLTRFNGETQNNARLSIGLVFRFGSR